MRNSNFAIGMLAGVLIALPVFAQADKSKSAQAKPQSAKTTPKAPLGPNPAWNPYAVFRQFKFIAALDPNSDGEVSDKELESALESLKKLDVNSDGKLDAEEFIKAAPIPAMVKNFGAFKALDLDKDDALSAEELAGAVEALKKLDANKNGKLDPVEYAMMSPMSMGGGGGGAGGGAGGGGGRQQPSPEEFVKQNDKDGDGKVQKKELTGMIVGFFDRMDTDKDGSVTVEEVKASRERQRQQNGGGAGGGGGRGGAAPGGPGAAPPAEKKADAPKEETPKADAPK
jgi:Ca2+-binding EF-hand superfamily protein